MAETPSLTQSLFGVVFFIAALIFLFYATDTTDYDLVVKERNTLIDEKRNLESRLTQHREESKRTLKDRDAAIKELQSQLSVAQTLAETIKQDVTAKFSAKQGFIHESYEKYVAKLRAIPVSIQERMKFDRRQRRLARREEELELKAEIFSKVEQKTTQQPERKQICGDCHVKKTYAQRKIDKLETEIDKLRKQNEQLQKQNEELKR